MVRHSDEGCAVPAKGFPVPDPACSTAIYDAITALTTARAQAQAIQRRAGRGPCDPSDLAGALGELLRSLDRVCERVRVIETELALPAALLGWDAAGPGDETIH